MFERRVRKMKFKNYLEILLESGIDNEIRIGGIQHLISEIVLDIKNKLGYGSIKRIIQNLKVARRTFNGWIEKHPIPISKFYQLLYVWQTICNRTLGDVRPMINRAFLECSYFSVSRGKKAKLPKLLTSELSYLIGYIMGDGCLVDIWKRKKSTGNFKYEIKIATDTKEFAKFLLRMIKRIFDVKCYIYKCNSKCYEIFIECKVVYLFLNKLCEIPMGKKKGKLKIPKIILNSSKEIKYAFIGGFFDADGCIFEKQKFISFTQADRGFLIDLSNLLENLGINTRPIYTTKKELGITYTFSIRFKSLKSFLDNVKVVHPDRIRRANNLRDILTMENLEFGYYK